MTLLSDKDLSLMRTTAGAALPDTCVIRSQSFASDGGGGGSATWAASGTVDCRLAPISLVGRAGREGEEGERLSAESGYIVTLPHDANVTTEKQLVINGGTFGVTAIRDRSWEITQRVEVERVT